MGKVKASQGEEGEDTGIFTEEKAQKIEIGTEVGGGT